jgi:S1-C subfamily serine protease
MVHLIVVVLVATILVLALLALAEQMKRSTASAPTKKSQADATHRATTAGPAVVSVETTRTDGTIAFGTGMLLTPGGEILTNNHLIAGAAAIAVRVAGRPRPYVATVRGYDTGNDVAVLALAHGTGLPTIRLADSGSARTGAAVVAVGRADDATHDLTAEAGRIAALHQRIDAASESLSDMMILDAPTRPTDSGGPIIDAGGNVIGMTTAGPAGARFAQQTSALRSFAIPIDTVIAIANRIDTGHSIEGVHVGPTATLGVAIGARGLVTRVDVHGPAARGGITMHAVIVAIDDAPIAAMTDLVAALDTHAPGDAVHVDWASPDGVFHTSVLRLAPAPPA